jgi:hypothetical protein
MRSEDEFVSLGEEAAGPTDGTVVVVEISRFSGSNVAYQADVLVVEQLLEIRLGCDGAAMARPTASPSCLAPIAPDRKCSIGPGRFLKLKR